MIKNFDSFHVQQKLFAMSDKRKYIKSPYARKKRKAWNKLAKLFRNRWNRRQGNCNQGKWINEYEYGKRVVL